LHAVPRDSNIPMFLWIATAVLAHLLGGGGMERAARVIDETLDIQRFAAAVRNHVRLKMKPVEVTLIEQPVMNEPTPPEAAEGGEEPAEEPPEVGDDEPDQADKKDRRTQDSEPSKPEPLPEPEQKKQELVIEKKKPAEDEEKQELPELDKKKRIAVQQHIEEPNEADNPDAEFIADQANKVAEQTQARITSTDQNDTKPSPGGNYAGPTDNPGNAHETRVAQSEDRPGEQDRAPDPDQGAAEAQRVAKATTEQPRAGRPNSPTPEARAPEQRGAPRTPPAPRHKPEPGQTARSAVPHSESSPDLLHAENGGFGMPERSAAQKPQRARPPKKRRLPPPRSRGYSDLFGLGAQGGSPNGVNLNLTPGAAVAAIGRDTLVRERKADAERRLSQHRGSWQSLGIERWRAAIENYVPSVKPGNQTALNTARVPFATYLNTIHNRLHPIFADSFLGSLSSLPSSHPMNRDISTNLEIVLNQDDGRIVRMGITKTSGVTAFDIAALESVQRAQPFGAPPREIVSPDGNVYFHWEFWRNPFYACSTYFARPYLLKVKPKAPSPNVEPPSPIRPFEDGRPEKDRHGWLDREHHDSVVRRFHTALR
jgi:hypothetical protein